MLHVVQSNDVGPLGVRGFRRREAVSAERWRVCSANSPSTSYGQRGNNCLSYTMGTEKHSCAGAAHIRRPGSATGAERNCCTGMVHARRPTSAMGRERHSYAGEAHTKRPTSATGAERTGCAREDHIRRPASASVLRTPACNASHVITPPQRSVDRFCQPSSPLCSHTQQQRPTVAFPSEKAPVSPRTRGISSVPVSSLYHDLSRYHTDVQRAVDEIRMTTLRPRQLSSEEMEAARLVQRTDEFRTQLQAQLCAQKSEQAHVFASSVTDIAAQCFGALRKLPALRFFEDDALHRLVRRARVRNFSRYAAIYAEGALALSLVVLVQGCAHCSSALDVGSGRRVSAGNVCGLEALASLDGGAPALREESAIASQPCICLLISQPLLCSLMEHGSLRPEAWAIVRNKQRQHTEEEHSDL